MALFIRKIGDKAFAYFLLSVGWLYYLVILKFVSLTDIEFQNEVSLTIYAIMCFLVVHFLRIKSPIPKEMVDVIYYTVGMLGVLLFLWSQADSERRFPFQLDITLLDAITENSDEIESAKEFSRLFYEESDFLISIVNHYLSEAPSRNAEASCVHEFSQYESIHVGLGSGCIDFRTAA